MGRRGTRVEYAAHAKVVPSYVTKLGKQGRLVLVDVEGRQLVDFDATDAKVRGTTNLGRAANGANAGGTAAATGAISDLFRKAQTQERAFSARLLELKYQKAAGKAVLLADVDRAVFEAARGLRDAMTNSSRRLAAEVATITSPAECESIIARELRGLLEAFTAEIARKVAA